MIPYQFRSKMGKYEVELHGDKVKVTIVDDALLIAGKILKLKNSIDRRVMGLDFKISSSSVKQLLLCSGNRCWMIPNSHNYHEEVRKLLSDNTICFAGTEMKSKLDEYKWYGDPICNSGVDIGHLAARVLKKPNLEKGSLVELAGEVGMAIKPLATPGGSGSSTSQEPNWDALVFSDEDIKYAIYDVYTSYVIANNLLGML